MFEVRNENKFKSYAKCQVLLNIWQNGNSMKILAQTHRTANCIIQLKKGDVIQVRKVNTNVKCYGRLKASTNFLLCSLCIFFGTESS